jgi:uncharacterized protein
MTKLTKTGRQLAWRLALVGVGVAAVNVLVRRQQAVPVRGSLAVVTGASAGIGTAVAHLLAAEGARVILLARNQTRLNKQVDDIRAGGGIARAYSVDLGDPVATAQTAQRLLRENGTPQIVVHCAGAGRWLDVAETSGEEVRQMLSAPYLAAFDLTRELLPAMREHGRGHILLINSPAAYHTWPHATGYAASRAALRTFAQGLRGELRHSGIHVSHITAGLTDTDYFTTHPGTLDRLPNLARFIPTLTPDQVAQTVLHTIRWNQPEVITPWQLNALVRLGQLFPTTAETLLRL